mgnify:CR=1 FL=1
MRNLNILSPTTLTFLLPGLVHQFGNLLLTMQGHVSHVQDNEIKRMQEAVLGAVAKGGASLQVMRVLLGERVGVAGSAYDLLQCISLLGRVAAREAGVTVEHRGLPPSVIIGVPAEPFILSVSETLRHWVNTVRSGGDGVASLTLSQPALGQVHVLFGYEAQSGTLPFPIRSDVVASAASRALLLEGVKIVPVAGSGDSNDGVRVEINAIGGG